MIVCDNSKTHPHQSRGHGLLCLAAIAKIPITTSDKWRQKANRKFRNKHACSVQINASIIALYVPYHQQHVGGSFLSSQVIVQIQCALFLVPGKLCSGLLTVEEQAQAHTKRQFCSRSHFRNRQEHSRFTQLVGPFYSARTLISRAIT